MSEDAASQPPPSVEGPSGPWTHRVRFGHTSEGYSYAYRPHEVITSSGPQALDIALKLFGDRPWVDDEEETEIDEQMAGDPRVSTYEGPRVPTLAGEIGPFSLLTGIADPLVLIVELRAHNIEAQPNHVYFGHSIGGNPAWGNPAWGNPAWGNPAWGNPAWGNPAWGNPAWGNPAWGNPAWGNPAWGNPAADGTPVYGYGLVAGVVACRHPVKRYRSSALPPPPHTHIKAVKERIGTPLVANSPRVIVLDTGLAAVPYRPSWLGSGITDAGPQHIDWPTNNNGGYLCPAAGHGTFVAGVVAQIAPGCAITLHRVLSDFDEGDEWKISHTIHNLVTPDPDRTILNCSFGGYVLDHPHLMAWTIRKIQHRKVTVVASAGNDSTFRPSFPAALPDVIGVGALSPSGPAWFTNFGAWVDACAPGTNVLSCFFDNFNGPADPDAFGFDPDDYHGWAVWSGTSFSAPAVVGSLARAIMDGAATTKHAVARIINAEALTVIPYLGTVVDAL